METGLNIFPPPLLSFFLYLVYVIVSLVLELKIFYMCYCFLYSPFKPPPSFSLLSSLLFSFVSLDGLTSTHTRIILCFYIKSKNHKGEMIYNVFRCLINSFNVPFSSGTCFPVNHITVWGTGLELFSPVSASQMLIL